MATGRPSGRPRTRKGAADTFANITPEDLDKVPEIPEHLNEDGSTMWIYIWAGAHTWLHETDEFIVTELCEVYQDKEFYRRAIDLNDVPRTYRTSNKTIIPHPYISLLKDSRAQMRTYFSSLGFSPADRAKIGAIEALSDDPLAEMMKAKMKRTEARRNGAEPDDG